MSTTDQAGNEGFEHDRAGSRSGPAVTPAALLAPELREGDKTASDLFAIFGGATSLEVAGRTVIIKPLTLGKLPVFLHWYGIWRRGSNISEQADEASGAAEIVVLEMLTGESYDWLSELSDDDIHRVIVAAFSANPTLFELEEDKRSAVASPGGARSRRNSLQASIAQLVEAGHSLAAIEEYSLQQVEVLCRAHAQLAAERQINAIVAVRAGQADAKTFKSIVKDLEQAAQANHR